MLAQGLQHAALTRLLTGPFRQLVEGDREGSCLLGRQHSGPLPGRVDARRPSHGHLRKITAEVSLRPFPEQQFLGLAQ